MPRSKAAGGRPPPPGILQGADAKLIRCRLCLAARFRGAVFFGYTAQVC